MARDYMAESDLARTLVGGIRVHRDGGQPRLCACDLDDGVIDEDQAALIEAIHAEIGGPW